MIMRSGPQLLLPVKLWFVLLSLLLALCANIALDVAFGRQAWMPDVLALVVLFWAVHQPRLVGIGAAFVFGVMVDVHQAALLGQHAWGYTLLAYLGLVIHRRLLWYPVSQQALQTLPLFFAMHLLEVCLRAVVSGQFLGVGVLVAPMLEAALWPVATWVLLAPQRRAPEQDDHRPL
jgi:rod shape-determining protein MreD